MEAKEKQIIVTEKWLEENGAYEDDIQDFRKYFPNGGEALEVLKWCGELNYIDFGEWLVDHLPPIYPPLELNTLIDSLFYLNDVHIKGDISIQGLIYIKGSLKVDGKLTVNRYGAVYSDKGCVNADEIDISGYAQICSDTKANSIIMSDSANISGNTKAKIINFKGGYINGDVDANEIINDGGWIDGNVNTFTIENINGGWVAGKITYKRSDEHK